VITSHTRIIAVIVALVHSALMVIAAEHSARPIVPSLAPVSSAESAPDADGFIQRWLILEPIRANTPLTDNAITEAIRKEYFPNQLSVMPRDNDKAKVGETELTWHAVDTKAYNVNLYHFAYALGKPTSNVLFWAVTVVNCLHDMHDVRLAIGSNAASIWWLNGEEVIGLYGDRQTVIDDGVSKRVTLTKGLNTIRAAVINAGGATDFCARFLDEQGQPVKAITISVTDR